MRPGHLNLQSIAQQVDKLLFVAQAIVGAATSRPPGSLTECLVEWHKCGKLVRIRPTFFVIFSLCCAGGW